MMGKRTPYKQREHAQYLPLTQEEKMNNNIRKMIWKVSLMEEVGRLGHIPNTLDPLLTVPYSASLWKQATKDLRGVKRKGQAASAMGIDAPYAMRSQRRVKG